MSKLPNAPLLEVIFEIKWDIVNKSDMVDFQYLHGDLYSNLKDKFPYRESLVPPEVPYDALRGLPIFRYRKDKDCYPLVQIGPGVITINTTDDTYYWDNFRDEINQIVKIFSSIYSKYENLQLSPILTYLDFLEYDKKKITPIEYINSNLQLEVKEHFLNINNASLNDVNFTFNYSIKEDTVSLNLRDGEINKNKNGIIMQNKIIGKKSLYTVGDLAKWLNEAHELSSDFFKSMTKGNLYKSFK